MSLVFLQARPPPLTGGRVHSGWAQSTDANGGARGAPARAPDAFESPFDGGRRRTVVRSGRAMRRGSMSRVENRVGRCCGTKKKEGLRGKGRWNWRMRRLKKPALFPSPSFNSVPLFFFLPLHFLAFGLPSSPWLLVSSLSCSRPAQSVSITVREGVEEKERGGKGCVFAHPPFPFPLSLPLPMDE